MFSTYPGDVSTGGEIRPTVPDQRAIAERYLGEKRAERYLASMADGLATEVLLTLEPERWWSVDFSRLKL